MGVTSTWIQFVKLWWKIKCQSRVDFDQHVSHNHLRDSTPIFFLLFVFFVLSIHLSPFVLRLTLPKSLSFFLAWSRLDFFCVGECSGWEDRDVRGESTSTFAPAFSCVSRGCLCASERAHAWASSAVKVRLIHWLQLRGAERLAEFNSNLFTLLRPTNADRSVCATGCLPPGEDWRARASFYSNSLSLYYLANFGHVSNPHSKTGCLACFQIIAPFITKGPRGWLTLFAGSWSPFVVCILLLKLSRHQETAGWLLLT